MPSQVVILSPHFDDAVLNCWHLLTQPKSAVVMNIFAGSPAEGTSKFWDRVCGEADSPKMVRKRIQENEIAVGLSGSNQPQLYLDFLDNQYRSANPSVSEVTDEIIAKSPASCVYYAPLALSRIYRHPDHVLVRQAGIELHKRGYQVGFYPDSPYMSLPREPKQPSVNRLRSLSEKNLGFEVAFNVHKMNKQQQKSKSQAMHAYKTQYKMTNLESFGGLTRIALRGYEVTVSVPKISAAG